MEETPWMRFARPLHTPLFPMSLSISTDRREDERHAIASVFFFMEKLNSDGKVFKGWF